MAELLMLDVRTLAFVSSVSGFLMAATMIGIYFAGMRTQAVLCWAAAGAASGLGFLVGHVFQTLDLPVAGWVAAATANTLIGLGHGLVLLGVQSYLGLRPWRLLVAASVLAVFLSAFVVPEMRDSLRLRVIVNSGWFVLADICAGILLLRAREPMMRYFHMAAALTLLVFGTFLATRLGYALLSPALTTSFVQDPFQLAAFLINLMFNFALTMTLAVMLFREKEVEVMKLAHKDPLTGLHNRLLLGEFSQQALELARRDAIPLAMILIDIDHFKRFNDEFGHQVGDAMLQVVADRLKQALRGSDSAFRLGGEEFLIVLPGAESGHAAQVAERIRSSLADAPEHAVRTELKLTASFGVVEWHAPHEDWETFFRRADLALYEAKNAGRDRVVALPT